MSASQDDYSRRRGELTAQIARQRGELVQAYRNLEKPIHYAEYGMRGFGFLRQNPWIFAAAPALVSIVGNVLGWRKKKPTKGQLRQEQEQPEKKKGFVRTWTGHAWNLYQLYRRVRSHLP